jgi:hypothetical protein
LIVITALHVRYIYIMRLEDTNLEIIPPLAIESVELGYALISATIPNLKSFIMSFDTAMMMDLHGYRRNTRTATTSTPKTPSSFFWRSNPASHRLQYSDVSTQEELIGRLRPEKVEHRAEAHRVGKGEARRESLPGSRERESQEREIRIDIGWTVEEEYRMPTPPRPPKPSADLGIEKK